MKQKETYPIFNVIFYTVMVASAYWIYSTYTDRNPSQPKQVVQTKETPKQSATPLQKMTFEDMIASKAVKDSIDQGMIALEVKDYHIACAHFMIASSLVLSTKRKDDYIKMRDLENSVCKLAGVES